MSRKYLGFKDSSGRTLSKIREIYEVNWSEIDRGGCQQLTAALPLELITEDINLMDDVSLFDGLDEIWIGQVRKKPRISSNRKAAIVSAIGYWKHLGDNQIKRMYADPGYGNWNKEPGWQVPESWNWGMAEKDNNGRVFVRLQTNGIVTINTRVGQFYRLCSSFDAINQDIFTITFDYEVGAGYNDAVAKLHLYSYTGGSGAGEVSEFSLAGSGALSGSSGTVTITASKTELSFQLDGAGTSTISDDTFWFKITNIRVNGLDGFEAADNFTAEDVIENLLPTAEKISADYTKINPSGASLYNIPALYLDKPTSVLQGVQEVTKYDLNNWGVTERDTTDNPRFHMDAHDTAVIHYRTSLKTSQPELADEDIDEQYTAIDVTYNNPNGSGKLVERVEVSHTLLDAWGIEKVIQKSLDTTSQAAAQQFGATFLDSTNHGRNQAKGSIRLFGTVRDNFGVELPVDHIRPGRNILIYDMNPNPADLGAANVLNGKNCFRIRQVAHEKLSTVIQVDNEEESIPLLLARRG